MSQHVSACSESDGLWLPLTEYAVKSGISLSTIRRKIKSNSIKYRLEKGRYLIYFNGKEPVTETTNAPAPTPSVAPRHVDFEMNEPINPAFTHHIAKEEEDGEEAWPMDRAVKMISDAFEHTLREKDERIRLLEQRNHELEERLNELRTLVRALEEKYEVRY